MTEKHAILNPFDEKSWCSVREMMEKMENRVQNKGLAHYLLHQNVDGSGVGISLFPGRLDAHEGVWIFRIALPFLCW